MKVLTLTDTLRSKLSRLENPPEKLFCEGGEFSRLLERPIVAIVGTRKPTPYGKTVTKQLAEELARAGVVVISGNAMGIDGIAQEAALDAGGDVIAVLPSGLDNIYPATNRALATRMMQTGGVIITEYEQGHRPTRYDFLHRNRLIAALADLVIIPEAAEKSGSLNTATHAMKMNVPVGVVPGNITNHMSSGTNRLLKEGARVIRSAEDVLELLQLETPQQTQLTLEGDDDTQTAILQAIHDGIVDPHDIQSKIGLSATDYTIAVTMLEVQKRIVITDLGTLRLK